VKEEVVKVNDLKVGGKKNEIYGSIAENSETNGKRSPRQDCPSIIGKRNGKVVLTKCFDREGGTTLKKPAAVIVE